MFKTSEYLNDLQKALEMFSFTSFKYIVEEVKHACKKQGRIFVMGNGGSAATASHLACDLSFVATRKRNSPILVTCLNDNIPTMLAIANDISYNAVFSDQLIDIVADDDLVIGISGSGNSLNVLQAIRHANSRGAITIGITGFSGGTLKNICDYVFQAASDNMQIIEDVHLTFCHMLMRSLMEEDE